MKDEKRVGIEFDKNGRTEDLEIGKFYKAINNCFKIYAFCTENTLSFS